MKVKDLVSPVMYDDMLLTINREHFRDIREKSFLVTGGAGFIAKNIVLSLLSLNDETPYIYIYIYW